MTWQEKFFKLLHHIVKGYLFIIGIVGILIIIGLITSIISVINL